MDLERNTLPEDSENTHPPKNGTGPPFRKKLTLARRIPGGKKAGMSTGEQKNLSKGGHPINEGKMSGTTSMGGLVRRGGW